jgi:hypothetical protein
MRYKYNQSGILSRTTSQLILDKWCLIYEISLIRLADFFRTDKAGSSVCLKDRPQMEDDHDAEMEMTIWINHAINGGFRPFGAERETPI